MTLLTEMELDLWIKVYIRSVRSGKPSDLADNAVLHLRERLLESK